jgi:hypothetical protein
MIRKAMVVVALVSWTVALATASPVSAVSSPQAVVVSPNPVDGTPHVLDGRVYAIARVGSKVVLGGTFTAARNHNNMTQQSRVSILSYDYATGQIDQAFVPQLDGQVNALVGDTSGTAVFVGGSFMTVNGVANRGLVKLDLATGQTVDGFRAITTGAVNDLVVHGDRLYVGGVFGKIKGMDRPGLAAVSMTDGAVDQNLDLPVTEPMIGGAANVKKLDVSPDGSKLIIIGNFTMVGGEARTQMAIIDLSTTPASVSSWKTDLYGNTCNPILYTYMRDVDISPDGSYAVVVTTGGPGNLSAGLCDTAARWELDRTGPGQTPFWTDWTGGDTLLSVAVTNAAVYIGGHQRWANNADGNDSAMPSAVSREGIGALDPLSGRALTWNPGRTRGYGATALVATPEVLFVGSDTEQLGGEFHGRIGMFPVAGGTAPVIANPSTSPTNLYLAESDGDLMRTAYLNGPTGTAALVSGPGTDGINWSTVLGTFMVNGKVYTVASNGSLNVRTYNGTTFGPSTVVPSWLALTSVTSLTYLDGFLFYTKNNDPRLYRRGMTLDGMLIDPIEKTVSGNGDGLDWRGVTGLAAVDRKMLAAYSNGSLTSTDMNRGIPVAASRTTISSPVIDGRNWNGRDLFAFSRAPK